MDGQHPHTGGRSGCRAHGGEVVQAAQQVQGWAGEAALRGGDLQGVHGVRQRWAHAVRGVRQRCVQGMHGWATSAGVLSCYPVVHFRDTARLSPGRGGNGTGCCWQRKTPGQDKLELQIKSSRLRAGTARCHTPPGALPAGNLA